MKKINYKVPSGKLLRIRVGVKEGIIKNIKITGDFFIHPETAIQDIENLLIGKKVKEIEKELSDFLNEKKIQIIGFTAKDLQDVISDVE